MKAEIGNPAGEGRRPVFTDLAGGRWEHPQPYGGTVDDVDTPIWDGYLEGHRFGLSNPAEGLTGEVIDEMEPLAEFGAALDDKVGTWMSRWRRGFLLGWMDATEAISRWGSLEGG